MNTDRELIAFGVHLTGHDEDTIKQMLNDYKLAGAINSSATKARAVRQNSRPKTSVAREGMRALDGHFAQRFG